MSHLELRLRLELLRIKLISIDSVPLFHILTFDSLLEKTWNLESFVK